MFLLKLITIVLQDATYRNFRNYTENICTIRARKKKSRKEEKLLLRHLLPRLTKTLFFGSPKPTAEEILLWGQSFDKLMQCPSGRSAFRQFLRTEFSEENMLFWLACEEFSKETNKSSIEEKARIIYEDYISILSPKEVSERISACRKNLITFLV